ERPPVPADMSGGCQIRREVPLAAVSKCSKQRLTARVYNRYRWLPVRQEWARRHTDNQDYSILILAVRMTLPHFSYSNWMKRANSSGELTSGSPKYCTSTFSRKPGAATIRRVSALILPTMSPAVPFGAWRPNHAFASSPGSPLSEKVGESGNEATRSRAPTPSTLSFPSFHKGSVWPTVKNIIGTWPATTSVIMGATPL